MKKEQLKYKQIFYNKKHKTIIEIPFDITINYKNIFKLYQYYISNSKYDNKDGRIVFNINKSIYTKLRIKNSNYKL